MLQTVEAEIDASDDSKEKGNAQEVLEFLRNHHLPESSRRTAEEIDTQIEELRNSWD